MVICISHINIVVVVTSTSYIEVYINILLDTISTTTYLFYIKWFDVNPFKWQVVVLDQFPLLIHTGTVMGYKTVCAYEISNE